MKLLGLCSLLLLSVTSLPAQGLKMQMVNGANGSSWLCDPWSCTPSSLDVTPGTPLSVVVRGAAVSGPFVLMLGGTQSQCVPVPGFSGSLILSPPIAGVFLKFDWVRVTIYAGPGQAVCGGWLGFEEVALPAGLPKGIPVLTQLLGLARPGSPNPPMFSNSVQVTAR